MTNLSKRSAREGLRKKTPTQMQLDALRLPVSDARFERAMEMAARYMGGKYRDGTIRLPYHFKDRTFPTEFTVLYRKLPCGFLTNQNDGQPCVTFDIIPNIGRNPRRSKVYKSFPADLKSSKVQFGKFLGWLRIVGDAVRRYVAKAQAGQDPQFAKLAMPSYREPEQSNASYRKEKDQMAESFRNDAAIPYAFGDKWSGEFMESVARYVDRQSTNMFGPSQKQWDVARKIEKKYKKYFDMRPRSRGIAQAQKDAKEQNAPKPDKGNDPRLKVMDQLLSRMPNNSFLKSLRDQVAKGRTLSPAQLKPIRQMLYKNRMRSEADMFRAAAKRVAAKWLAKQGTE